MKQIIAAILVVMFISVEPTFTQITRRYYVRSDVCGDE